MVVRRGKRDPEKLSRRANAKLGHTYIRKEIQKGAAARISEGY